MINVLELLYNLNKFRDVKYGRESSMNFTAKCTAIIGFFLILLTGNVFAEDMYVTDSLKLTLRSGPSTEYKILAVIDSGQQVEIVERGDEWSIVRLPDGKEGHVLTRYLTTDPPSSVQLERLRIKYDNLTKQSGSLIEDNDKFKSENEQLKAKLSASEAALEKLKNDYESLRKTSTGALDLKAKYETASQKLTSQTQQVNQLEEQLAKIELNQYIKWFLAGSGVLLLGFIIGFSTRRQRRRSSLL